MLEFLFSITNSRWNTTAIKNQRMHNTAKSHISFLIQGSSHLKLKCATEEQRPCFTTASSATTRITAILIYTTTKNPCSRPIAKQLPFSVLQTLLVKVNPATQRLQFRSWFCILHNASVNTSETPNLINYICLGPSIHPAYCWKLLKQDNSCTLLHTRRKPNLSFPV